MTYNVFGGTLNPTLLLIGESLEKSGLVLCIAIFYFLFVSLLNFIAFINFIVVC